MNIAEFILKMEVGGAQDIVKKYAYALLELGNEVTIIVYTAKTDSIFEKELEEKHVKVIYIGEMYKLKSNGNGMTVRWERQMKSMTVLYRVLDNLRPDIFHIHSELFRAFVWMPWKKWKTKLVFTAHSECKIIFHSKLNILFAKWLYSRFHMNIIALSEEHFNDLARLFGKKRIYVVRNGIDTAKYQRAESMTVKRELSLEHKFVVGNVGRFESVKNHIFMIEIFNEIAKKRSDAVLLLIGTGSLESDILCKIKQYNLQEKVICTGVRNDIPELLKVMDVFLMPSLFEGIPIALIEAQVAGLKCVISDSIRNDAVISGKTEKVSLNKDAAFWAEKIISENEYSADIDYKKYDLKQCINTLLKVYQS